MLGGYLSKNLARHLQLTSPRASLPSIRSRYLQRDAIRFPTPPLAFAFDIDGVLIRGEDVLPPAKRALSILEGDNAFKMKLPYILLTNGGGVSEQERCEKLSAKLGFKIHPHQYIQAHTILKTLSHKYTDAPVLVLGGKRDQVRQVAAGYGFKKAYTTLDVLAWNPSVWPFHQLTMHEAASTKDVDFSQTPISAVFVFHDPRNWALDVQVLCDVIQSAGVIGGPYVPLEQQTKPVELVFCNPDLIWRSDFDRPRIGQGGFKAAFQGVFKSLTGSEYPHVQFGKPTRATYDFATQVLSDRVKELTGSVGPLPPV
ncbi:Haloacid dehalogenase-like hydrolase-domain-containing protein [Mycena alexandri]|uniref:Haloacid dehalogenase-like hydrolase-domain-containing protein n=1 Tax=Mycena alexandri TaxID=1745969 RepID=A0AAD6X762_9AGAR|nr:Haloacid dehalogenase-like hydrolase-domain-containing protein [Mycena alexandri]